MPKLTEAEIAGRLPSARGWERLGDMLVRSWQFPSSRRALEFVTEVVERAGRTTEIVIKAIALDVILIAGFSTLVVNGNPLLRFDGYYILSDLLEIPNLGSRAAH